MTSLDSLTKSFDKLFLTSIQNILGTNIEVCKWSFIITSIGVGINVFVNSFYFIKMNNENNTIKNKLNLLLNETKIIAESNVTIYEIIKKNSLKIDSVVENTKAKKNAELEDDMDCYYIESHSF
jgi:hypothetical protein